MAIVTLGGLEYCWVARRQPIHSDRGWRFTVIAMPWLADEKTANKTKEQ